MLKLSFLSKGIKKLVTNKLFTKEFHNIIKNKSLVNIPKRYFTEINKNPENNESNKEINLEKKLSDNTHENLKDKIKNEEIISNLNLNFDTKIDSISSNDQTLNEKEIKENSENKENNTNNKPKEEEEIEQLRKLLPEFYYSKMSMKEYKNIANTYKEKLHSEFLVIFLLFYLYKNFIIMFGEKSF